MKHTDIRDKFVSFFKSKGHTYLPSDSLVPAGDQSLLFTSAGMAQFKEQFMGNIKGFTRAVTCQKCLRTGDLENVGRTAYHHTFFEMLGNFSFGDYFKEDAIFWAWEFLIKELKIPEDKLWVSVYEEDDEAYSVWRDKVNVPESKIVKLGQKDNFWPSEAKDKGPNGPCGPCSEIFYDYGKDTGCKKDSCSPACGCGRFVEVWNLVFTQFERKDNGALDPLPNKNIDTGMGLERLCAVLQGVKSNFQTDIFADIIKEIKVIMPEAAKEDDNSDIYAISDHARAVVFAICDGVAPSNEERGYVIRNLLRKAITRAKKLGIDSPFLYKLVYVVAKTMQPAYPEVMKEHQDIAGVVKAEEERFYRTLENGMPMIEEAVLKSKNKGSNRISGGKAFELYDTHGIPLEIIKEIASEKDVSVDEAGFDSCMQKQRESSRKSSKMQADIFAAELIKAKTEFIGYDECKSQARILQIMDKDGKQLDMADKNKKHVKVILDKSVFYGEQGGQAGDRGRMSGHGAEVVVNNALKIQDAIVLDCEIRRGRIAVGDEVRAEIDIPFRNAVAKNHTATHLLQWALRKTLGEHVKQQGSHVADDRLRFDFTHSKALTDDELKRVESLVNEKIKQADDIEVQEMPLEQAKGSGALAFFGDKYEQKVRVVRSGAYSRELCGGTHLKNTADIELFRVMHEGSVASGIRRIEACTSDKALEWEKTHRARQKDKENLLKKKKEEKADKKRLIKESEKTVDEMIERARQANNVKIIIECVDNFDMGIIKHLSGLIRNKLKHGYILFLAGVDTDKTVVIASISKDLEDKGINAASLLSDIISPFDGKAGGRRDMAQGGIKNFKDIKALIKSAEETILAKELA